MRPFITPVLTVALLLATTLHASAQPQARAEATDCDATSSPRTSTRHEISTSSPTPELTFCKRAPPPRASSFRSTGSTDRIRGALKTEANNLIALSGGASVGALRCVQICGGLARRRPEDRKSRRRSTSTSS